MYQDDEFPGEIYLKMTVKNDIKTNDGRGEIEDNAGFANAQRRYIRYSG